MTVTPIRVGWLILSSALFVLLAYTLQRTQFAGLLGLYFLAVWGYSLRVNSLPDTSTHPDRFLMAAAVLFRVLLLLAPPNLSDDYARFIWDGRLLIHGFNPYLYLPRSLVSSNLAEAANLTPDLFARLNSPDYFTVYPPLNQAFFGLAAWLGGDNLTASVIWLRVPILLAELGTIFLLPKLLQRLGRNPDLACLYTLNPLVILELTGNVHFEGVVIFFCIGAVWMLKEIKANSVNGAPEMSSLDVDSNLGNQAPEMTSLQTDSGTGARFPEMLSLDAPPANQRPKSPGGRIRALISSAILLGLAVSTKLLPLLGLPLLIRYLGWKRGLLYSTLVGIITGLLFLPFTSVELVQNVASSINLYFQKFEFNASVYYLIREVGYWLMGYNVIQTVGHWLPVVTLGGIGWLAFRARTLTYGIRLLLSLTLYFALATTVHPWYCTLLVAVSPFTPFRYPLVWSALIWISYATYQTEDYRENLWLTAAEYIAVLAVGLAEWWRYRQSKPSAMNQIGKKYIG
ncbi:hypothetical protein F5984_15440 [Rudanella paleaurantiibacter]|uniref:DUF2029 domain-containing protein n=1 Tax=Rudanella paleaurantiibacter TaxID=2614655 RepID=A0A7J5TWN7_9BACT|nr:hypothetical protein [Rudanella paleaurantiibacter]KAB7729044.1 hypothetical protein F5984_15440 [Rudanella paleaurantiibacter]